MNKPFTAEDYACFTCPLPDCLPQAPGCRRHRARALHPLPSALLWDLEETARRLGGVSIRTVRRLIEQDAIRPHKIGRRLLVVAASVQAYLDPTMPRAHNFECAGPDVQEKSTCQQSAKTGTKTASIVALTPRSGGRRTSMPVERELDALLGRKSEKKPKRC